MDFKLPKEVKDILDKFRSANFQIYIVGGAVRDLLMDKEVKDWDFTTDASPEEILKLFQEGFLERSSQKGSTFGEPFYDNKFGTVGIPFVRGGGERGVPMSTRILSERSESKGRTSTYVSSRQDPEQTTTIFEVTTMRKEGEYQDFRHPSKIDWTNKIEEDLARRDFTINALAFSVIPAKVFDPESSDRRAGIHKEAEIPDQVRDDNFVLIDPFHGQNDIKAKLVTAVGDPEKRFREDALRLIRAVRLSAELEFEIEKNTLKAIQENAQLIKEVSGERIRDELSKILASMNPYIGIIRLREAGIAQIVLPELERCFGVVQEGPKHDRVYDIGEHSLLSLKHCPSKDPLVKLAALLHDIGKPKTVKEDQDGNVTFYNHDVVGGNLVLDIAKRFNLSKKQTDKLFRLVRWHMFTVTENQTDSAIRRFIKNVGLENVSDMMSLRIGDRLGGGTQNEISWRMAKFRERINDVLKKPFSITDLKINGHDVMKELNLKPGPKVGEVLDKLFQEVLEDSSKNNREYLIERIKQIG